MTLFFLCMLPTVLALGNWQLARARYKETLEQEFFDRLAAAPTAAPAPGPPSRDAPMVEAVRISPFRLS
jgi:cytochrome oxidase assembly protein ShyY1